jgi:hypothetical protein
MAATFLEMLIEIYKCTCTLKSHSETKCHVDKESPCRPNIWKPMHLEGHSKAQLQRNSKVDMLRTLQKKNKNMVPSAAGFQSLAEVEL